MPLVYQHTINNNTKLGLWHIQEPEEFFLKKVPLKRDVTHPHKRFQHLAGRYLLPTLFEDFPLEEILIADTRKPFLPEEQYHFSISHCGNFAAAIASSEQRVGIDIEQPTEKIFRIIHKFLNENEKNLLDEPMGTGQLLQMATLLWSSKEAMFKWYGNGGVDFKNHMHIEAIHGTGEEGKLHCQFLKQQAIPLNIHYRFMKDLVMSWVVSS
jgi:phosphopantetheinyl transferase